MTTNNERLQELSDELNEHIIAVKGTMELVDASITEEDLHDLLVKAIERIDTIQKLSGELFAALKHCIDKMSQT